jgi:hypothetical protein
MSNQENIFLNPDVTGISPNNLITQETHTLPSNGKIIRPNFLAYYTKSLAVSSVSSLGVSTLLIRDSDYSCTELFEKTTALVGNEVCATILINNHITDNTFIIEYQAYGGFSNPNNKLIAMVINNELDKKDIPWNEVLNKPIGYNPKQHLHDWLDLYGLEYITVSIDRLTSAINNAPTYKQLGVASKIDALLNQYPIYPSSIHVDNSHPTDHLNVHHVTKEQVNLSNVVNLRLCNDYINVVSNLQNTSYYTDYKLSNEDRYVSPNSINKYITEALQINNDNLITSSNSAYYNINAGLLAADLKLTSILNIVNDVSNASIITSFINTISLVNTQYLNINTYLKQYRLVNYNSELATILKAIVNNKHVTINGVYNVPDKLSNLALWIDVSDPTTQVINNYKVVSITDKSSNAIVFTNSNINKQPTLTANNTNVVNEINQFNTALFDSSNLLTSASNVVLNNEFTIISLHKTKVDSGVLLSNTSNQDSVRINVNGKILDISTSKLNISSKSNTSTNFKSILSIAACSSLFQTEQFVSGNVLNSNNLDTSEVLSNSSITFNSIGSNTTNAFELAELIVYNRKLSKLELDALIKYLSKKWCNTYDFTNDLTFIQTL